jgi:peptidoglycan/LPS O-acetylase OafA/YrhL
MTLPLPQAKRPSRIPSLDGLRAVSIFMVVALHTLQRFSITHHVAYGWYSPLNGVPIFFEISGFLITSLLLQEHEKTGSISLRDFYIRRVFRILPPLYFYIAVVVLLGVLGRLELYKLSLISAVFFFHNVAPDPSMWSLEHLWSISVEEQFYLWWPCALVLCLRRSPAAGRKAAAMIAFVILIISPPLRVLFGMQRHHPLLHEIGIRFINLDFLMFGCIVALLQHTRRFESIYRAATRIWWAPVAAMFVFNFIAARYENYFNLPVGFTLSGAAIAIFLLWCTRNPESSVGRALNWAPIVHIGVLSYSIYLWQTLFLHHENISVFGTSPIGKFPLNWLGFMAAATFSYYVIERPSLRLRTSILTRIHQVRRERALNRAGDIAVDS